MLPYAVTFFVGSIIAAFLGFLLLVGIMAEIAKILFVILLLLCVISVVAGRHPPV